ncbi:MAG: lysophospholipid acyltransferase family protein [Pseudomonadota bacterium]
MPDRLNRYWRVMATAFAFISFGVGGLLLRLIFFPLLALIVRHQQRKARLARLAIHYLFRWFIRLMRFLGVLKFRIDGVEKLNRHGLLILANHPTLIDVVFLISLVPNADCVVKSSLLSNPFTRGPMKASNYIRNDSGPGLVDDCIASLKAGNNLIVFPEGTRTPVSGPVKLQRGAANIALRGMCDITPVVIRCVPLTLTKGVPWWHVPARRVQFVIEVRDDLPVAPFLAQAGGEVTLAARRLTSHLHEYFLAETVPDAST